MTSPEFSTRAGLSEVAPRRFTWNAFLWALIFPQRAHRIVPTVPGMILVSLSFGIGLAAYNSSSNILFLTLSLLLTCLVLSGVLSWLNLRRVTWQLRVAPALRAGHDTMVGLELRNDKGFLPTYGLWFRFLARSRDALQQQRPESTISARGKDIRAALAQAEASQIRGRVTLTERLDSCGRVRLDWVFQPARRGWLRIELVSVGSLFPFGFLRKEIGTAVTTDVIVWPAPLEYRRHASVAAVRYAGEERTVRAGTGNDLLAVRRYNAGDSHRLIHWKASARTRQLLVRQYAAETAKGSVVWLRSDEELWPRADQFELVVRLAATLCEDLFRLGRLIAVAVDDEAPNSVRRVHDLELVLNRLSVLQRRGTIAAGAPVAHRGNVLTFAPEGMRGVGAFVDGQLIASV